MTNHLIKQIIIILLTCISIVLVSAIIFYQYIPSNKVIPSKVQAYSTPESIKSEIEENVEDELKPQNELYEITDSDLDLYRSTKSYNPGKSDPFSGDTSEEGEEDKSTSAESKNTNAPATEKQNNSEERKESSDTDRNTTDNYYTAENVNKGTK